MILGALIIKYIEKLDDRGVIASIQKNLNYNSMPLLPAST
ncbi:MAG: hypothetical protein J7L95_05035 [Prolixibacteraceae bacterium]|nr:hypothetical protein [Prolixibacteraceae bacterium]